MRQSSQSGRRAGWIESIRLAATSSNMDWWPCRGSLRSCCRWTATWGQCGSTISASLSRFKQYGSPCRCSRERWTRRHIPCSSTRLRRSSNVKYSMPRMSINRGTGWRLSTRTTSGVQPECPIVTSGWSVPDSQRHVTTAVSPGTSHSASGMMHAGVTSRSQLFGAMLKFEEFKVRFSSRVRSYELLSIMVNQMKDCDCSGIQVRGIGTPVLLFQDTVMESRKQLRSCSTGFAWRDITSLGFILQWGHRSDSSLARWSSWVTRRVWRVPPLAYRWNHSSARSTTKGYFRNSCPPRHWLTIDCSHHNSFFSILLRKPRKWWDITNKHYKMGGRHCCIQLSK